MDTTPHQARAEMLLNRVEKNRRRLRSWLRQEGVTCYRLYDRDIPEIPLIVDWYDGRLHVARLGRRDDAGFGPEQTRAVVRGLAEGLGVSPREVFIKQRVRGKGGTQYTPLGASGRRVEVAEDGLRFLVNLSDYLDTGLFLDHRPTRRRVRGEADGKRFLNLFAYTGSFTVHAAAGGAAETTSVDLSNTYLDWARENLRLNGFEGDRHRFVRDDILGALEARRVEGRYDLAVIDPPTVSRSKAMARPFDVQRDHPLLLGRVLERITPGGVVYFSSNLKRFRLTAGELGCREISDISEETIPPDFRNRSVHKCFRLVK